MERYCGIIGSCVIVGTRAFIKDGTTDLLVTGPNSDGIQQITLVMLLTYHCISSASILAKATCRIDVKATAEDVLAGKKYSRSSHIKWDVHIFSRFEK